MSVLDDFVLMRLYRKRAAEFDELADIEGFSVLGRSYRTIARHYKELADREERLDKARVAERLELLRVKRQRAAAQAALAAESGAQILILRAGFRAQRPQILFGLALVNRPGRREAARRHWLLPHRRP